MELAKITLALVTYNQAPYLRQFLENFRQYGQGKVELLIVDDGSTDDTIEILATVAGEKGFIPHRIIHGGISKARNFALQQCPSPWLAFSDSDCILDDQYFQTLITLPERFPQAVAIEGAVLALTDPKPPFTHSLENKRGGMYVTANMAFCVSQVIQIGGFDELFQNYREDADLALRILAEFGPIPFLPEWRVYHPHIPLKFIPALQKAFRNQALILASEIRLYKKHPMSYKKIRFHKSAHATVKNWCIKYSVQIQKEAFIYFCFSRHVTHKQKLDKIQPALKAMAVSFFEHLCLIVLCMVQWKKIKELR